MTESTNAAPVDQAQRPEAAIRFIGDLQRVQMQPGDFFVLSCNEELPQETVAFIHHEFKKIAGEVPLLVLGKGMSIEAIDRSRALARLDRAAGALDKTAGA